ncbi:hypothetical protein NEOLEDRAFT_1050564, partial [Neolentinus lepideus HHB14362 ss-1]
LLWIASALSPQEIWERVLDESSTFRAEILAYLDGCHQGQFSTGPLHDIGARIKMQKEDDLKSSTWVDPITSLPIPPPETGGEDALNDWFKQVCSITDEIIYVSNCHDSAHGKGCVRGKPPYCRARYPRTFEPITYVDVETGAIRFKKCEIWINTFTVVVSYILRCNTDVTCLLSGTQVKAVVAYVTDYITKSSLKTYMVFEVVKAV